MIASEEGEGKTKWVISVLKGLIDNKCTRGKKQLVIHFFNTIYNIMSDPIFSSLQAPVIPPCLSSKPSCSRQSIWACPMTQYVRLWFCFSCQGQQPCFFFWSSCVGGNVWSGKREQEKCGERHKGKRSRWGKGREKQWSRAIRSNLLFKGKVDWTLKSLCDEKNGHSCWRVTHCTRNLPPPLYSQQT